MNTNALDQGIENFHVFIKTILLFELAEKCEEEKDIFLKNTLAKTSSLLQSINLLNDSENYNDGWILYRALTDRLAHVYYLEKNNSYEDFSKWTYICDFEDNNKARSDPRFKRVLSNPHFHVDNEQLKKYNQYKKENIKWVRPDVKKIFKEEGLDFIYKFGYYHASKHTHPMFNDGNYEFHKITGLKPSPFDDFPSENLIRNSLLLSSMLAQTCLNFMTFKFRRVVYDYIDSLRLTLDGNETSFKLNFLKIVRNFVDKNIPLSE